MPRENHHEESYADVDSVSSTVNRRRQPDVALQYDGVVDSPQWLLNPLAVGNALAGFAYVHGTYLSPDDGEASTAHPYGYTVDEVPAAIVAAEANCDETTHCQKHGDTIYVTLPARTLPSISRCSTSDRRREPQR